MDPAAIDELKRLYAKKHEKETVRSSKRRKVEVFEIQERHRKQRSQIPVRSPQSAESDFEHFPAGDITSIPKMTNREPDSVEVVSFDERATNQVGTVASQGYKSFMSGKVPKTGPPLTVNAIKETEDGSDQEDAADDLKKDKELQKLLRESHLLHAQGGDSLETTGKVRHKAISEQLVSFGAAKQKQRKMPIGMRKGIEAAATKREVATERYHKDNSIVTARKSTPVVKTKSNKTLHELNLGKYKNGKLSISRKEIDRVNGPRGGSAKGKRKRGFRDFSNIG